ncbi:hypothetical protein SFUMM280S_07733 [Streptomyces fumanus]
MTTTPDHHQVDADLPDMPAPRVREFPAHSIGGGLALLLGLAGLLAGAGLIAAATAITATGAKAALIIAGVLVAIAAFLAMCGLNMVAPGEAQVVQLFGRYRGTIRQDGLRWVNPFTSRTKISTRVRNHETAVLKVNDAYGNPIELAAVVVWRVEDTAQATFEVDDYIEFVSTQTEAAVRHIAIEYPYDAHEEGGLSLRGNAEEITEKLAVELHARVEAAGVQIIESPVHAPRLRPGDRLRDAPAAAGRRGRRRAAPDRGRRGRDGRDGARPDRPGGTSWNWTTNARRRWCPT